MIVRSSVRWIILSSVSKHLLFRLSVFAGSYAASLPTVCSLFFDACILDARPDLVIPLYVKTDLFFAFFAQRCLCGCIPSTQSK